MNGSEKEIEAICLCGKKMELTDLQRAQLWDTDKGRETLDWIKRELGEFKKVIHAETGIAYKVPTEHIVVHGLKGNELWICVALLAPVSRLVGQQEGRAPAQPPAGE